MNPAPTSLKNLHDIVLPDAPAFWPPDQGFWVLIALVTMLILTAAWLIYQSHKRNAYRRAGLTLLKSATSNHEINIIVKRVALAVFPRDSVAHLHGSNWIHFLESTCSNITFTPQDHPDATAPLDPQLLENARTWIRNHKVDTN